jgi:hypothetical protein
MNHFVASLIQFGAMRRAWDIMVGIAVCYGLVGAVGWGLFALYWYCSADSIAPAPMFVVWFCWPACLILSACMILPRRHPRREWRGAFKERIERIEFAVIGALLLVGCSYGFIHVWNRHTYLKTFEEPILEALRLVETKEANSKKAAVPRHLGNVLTIVCDADDSRDVRARLGKSVNVSSELGEFPNAPRDVETVVVVNRGFSVLASYRGFLCYPEARQWHFKVIVIDWNARQLVGSRSFDGSRPDTPRETEHGSNFYGTEPWEAISLWLGMQ